MRSFRLGASSRLFAITVALCTVLAGCSDLSLSLGPLYIETYGAKARELRNEQPANLELSFTRCQHPGPWHGTKVTRVEWAEGGELNCVVTIDANCSDDFWAGDYKIENENDLKLAYTTLRAGGEDACLCQVELRYRIRNLEKRDYAITVQQAGLVTP